MTDLIRLPEDGLERPKAFLAKLSEWSDSEFAMVAMGEDGEALHSTIVGVLADLIDGAEDLTANVKTLVADALQWNVNCDAKQSQVDSLIEALKPFADCCDQIADSEEDEEWAKFRLLIKDYRRAAAAVAKTEGR